MSLRLATFNVQHGRMPDGRVDPPFLAAAVSTLRADVVALQEVDRGQVRSAGADLAALVAQAMGAADHRYVPAVVGRVEPRRAAPGQAPGDDDPALALAPLAQATGPALLPAAGRVLRSRAGRAAARAYLGTWVSRRRARGDEPDDVPAYGIALISRYPVRQWRQVRLPLGSPWLFGRLQLGTDQPRVAVCAVVETPDGPLTVVTTHLSSGSTWNQTQLRWLAERLRGAPRPLVLMGDLNLRGSVPTELTGWRDLVEIDTYPRHRPWIGIDHVLVDDVAPAVGEPIDPGAPHPGGRVHSLAPARAVDLGISDHCAVVVDVRLGPPRP
ncbi:endonuclease/exonuclease/phosphatase family protein [Xylanimonas cellulosilytica]|nr:endonuclease/exonuclease/phosphatase family protein [Xylanimonas cellulosilytica]